MPTTYGKNIKMTIYGGSHDDHIGVRVSGFPRGISVNEEELRAFMARRAPGKNEYSTPRKETDLPEFISGVTDGVTDGGELHAIIRNTNQRSADYASTSFIPRPSHADFAARKKYGEGVDLRGGGHFSGRLTAPMCIVGGICLQYLKTKNIHIGAHIFSVGDVCDTPYDMVNVTAETLSGASASDFPCLDEGASLAMRTLITEARERGDSVGGVIECAAIGVPAGLGEHMFDGIENRISEIVFGIPAVKGIEFGLGFESARIYGSQNNDPFTTDGKTITTLTNNAGGILGGMSTGMPIVFRAAMKPTPSIFLEQRSVDMVSMTPAVLKIHGRHDPCIAVRAVPVFEAAMAIALFDLLLDGTEGEK